MLNKVDQKQDFIALEKEILKFWQEKDILKKYLSRNDKSDKKFSFLDGPITANNPMGVHHAWGRTYKDLWQRYKTMTGHKQRYQNGFDCQGLWVEVEVEKELGFKTKKDIVNYGLENFTNKCKERVLKYSAIQTEESQRLAMFMDWEHSYYTMSDQNNYAIWNFLKKCNEKGYLYKGHDVVPWCTRCGTAISQHEILTEEYKELTHKSLYVKFPLKDSDNIYFLVWTTTPWTLPANTGLAVGEDIEYVRIVSNESGEKYILAKESAQKIFGRDFASDKWEDGLEVKFGKDLNGLEYTSLIPVIQDSLDLDRTNAYKIWVADFVNTEEGTGIVHIAPGCGKEDFDLSKQYNIPVIDPIKNDEGEYKDQFGVLAGKQVGQVADDIIDLLESKIFKIEPFIHRYPTCWRCKSELIFRLVDEWYIRMDDLRQLMIDITKKINWLPSFGKDREIDWLNNMDDWLISKKRFWGLALPIFECSCGHFEVIGNKEELKERAVEGWDKFEGNSPHRPWVDEVKIKCSKCGKIVSRVPDVGNPWLDAGIVPYSTIPGWKTDRESKPADYFADNESWQEWFPPEFISESFPGQFKNWFYSLIAMSVVMENREPFQTVLGYASVKDEKGEEMHKSKGNAIWFDEGAEKIGVDTMRLMFSLQNPANNLLFGYNSADEIRRKYILILWNIYSFFITYANIDNWKPEKAHRSEYILDEWIMSELHSRILEIRKGLDKFDAQKPVQLMVEFIEILSTWYLRRSRDRRNEDFYNTMYEVLLTLSKVMAPIIPFITESIYQNLRNENDPLSVHLCDYPDSISEIIDKELMRDMNVLRQSVELAHSARTEAQIKVRQPLAKVIIAAKIKEPNKYIPIIADELNVKEVVFTNKIEIEDDKGLIKKEFGDIAILLDTNISEELKEEGFLRDIVRKIQDLRKKAGLNPGENVDIYFKSDNDEIKRFFEKNLDDLSKRTNSNFLPDKGDASKVEAKAEIGLGNIYFYTI